MNDQRIPLWTEQKLCIYDEIDSTNTEAKRLADAGAKEGTLIVAGKQTAGRGRRGRSWQDDKENSLLMSLILKPQFKLEKASMITLVQALAVRKGISVYTEKEVLIKWPNDILINKRKAAGILTELHLEKESMKALIIGTGVNVNQDSFEEEIREIATSIFLENGRKEKISTEALRKEINISFEEYYELFLESDFRIFQPF